MAIPKRAILILAACATLLASSVLHCATNANESIANKSPSSAPQQSTTPANKNTSAIDSETRSEASHQATRLNPSVDEARQRAEILHDLLHNLLHDVHRNYYREDEGLLLPATTFREAFESFSRRQHITIRWLGVDVAPMNIDHRPASQFEQEAVAALKSGQPTFDRIEDSRYNYAGIIRLTSECLKCHVPNRTNTKDRLAGIVISMSVRED